MLRKKRPANRNRMQRNCGKRRSSIESGPHPCGLGAGRLERVVSVMAWLRQLPFCRGLEGSLPTGVEMGYAKATTDEEFSLFGSFLCRFGCHRHKLRGCAAAERYDTPFSRWRHRKRTIRVGAGGAAEVSAIQGRHHLSGGRGSVRAQTDCARTTGLPATNSAFQFIVCSGQPVRKI
jgi:hypothetical protein